MKVLNKTMNRIIAIAVIVPILITAFTPVVKATPKSHSDWALEAIKNAMENKMATDIFFAQYTETVSRQEFAMLAIHLYEIAIGKKVDPLRNRVGWRSSFDDAELGGWVPKDINNGRTERNSTYYPYYVWTCEYIGIVKGVGNNKYNLYGNITREEMAVMLFRVIQAIDPSVTLPEAELTFEDSDQVADWAKKKVTYCVQNNIMQGTGNNKFSPLMNTTREQAIAMLYRYAVNKGFIKAKSLSQFKDKKASTNRLFKNNSVDSQKNLDILYASLTPKKANTIRKMLEKADVTELSVYKPSSGNSVCMDTYDKFGNTLASVTIEIDKVYNRITVTAITKPGEFDLVVEELNNVFDIFEDPTWAKQQIAKALELSKSKKLSGTEYRNPKNKKEWSWIQNEQDIFSNTHTVLKLFENFNENDSTTY